MEINGEPREDFLSTMHSSMYNVPEISNVCVEVRPYHRYTADMHDERCGWGLLYVSSAVAKLSAITIGATNSALVPDECAAQQQRAAARAYDTLPPPLTLRHARRR